MMNKETITIAGRKIGSAHEPFLVAEMSGNHNQSIERAFAIIDAAADAGAHAVKIQTYSADSMTLDLNEGAFAVNDPNSLWKGTTLYKLYEQAHTPREWHKPIFDYCKKRGVICFSSPFDLAAIDFLESLGAPAYKIASFENIDTNLIHHAAKTKKPLIISTGMASLSEIDEAVQCAKEAGCDELILLKCTSTYPSTPQDSNILTIPHMRQAFGTLVGLSDHSMGIGVPASAVALGAVMIEKHFTLSRAEGGVDSAFSLEPQEFRLLVDESLRAWQALGKVHYGPTQAEKKSKIYRRSLYVVQDMQPGEAFTDKNVRAIRPGEGLAPKYYEVFLGKKASRAIKRGTPLNWDMIG